MSEATNDFRRVASNQSVIKQHSLKLMDTTRRAWTDRPAEYLPVEASIAIGVGFAALTRGDWVIYEEEDAVGGAPMTVAEAERLAQREPEHDWCIHLVGPDQDRHYRRVGVATWQLYRWGRGFAGNGAGAESDRA